MLTGSPSIGSYGRDFKSPTRVVRNSDTLGNSPVVLDPCGAPSKKKATGTRRMFAISCKRPKLITLLPFSYFST